ncbi:MAG: hypothetical protein HRU19_01070 [Pseudobacteriovorax sp.]|nr:hypothetical protein [Pseudobacteriovorax sp.]
MRKKKRLLTISQVSLAFLASSGLFAAPTDILQIEVKCKTGPSTTTEVYQSLEELNAANVCRQPDEEVACEGSYDFKTVIEEGCTSLRGSLTIQDIETETGDLSQLGKLKAFRGNLTISDNQDLKNLKGLPNDPFDVKYETVRISNNPGLVSLEGFEASNRAKLIIIEKNKNLQELQGFSYLSILEGLIISSNESLETFSIPHEDGARNLFPQLGFVRGNVKITDNPALRDLNLFGRLMPNPSSPSGLAFTDTTIRGSVLIQGNGVRQCFASELSNWAPSTTIGGSLVVEGNSNITCE